MKFLFSTSDFVIIQRIRNKLSDFGIRCEVRGMDVGAALTAPLYVELWVGRGSEFSQAVSLFASGLECA